MDVVRVVCRGDLMMSEDKNPKQDPETRKQYIIDMIAQKTRGVIAKDMGVSRMQIYRDIKAMKESGEWTEWLEKELIRLHLSDEIDEITKYREIAKLYARTLTQRREVETNANLSVTFNTWRPHEDDPETESEHDSDKLLSA